MVHAYPALVFLTKLIPSSRFSAPNKEHTYVTIFACKCTFGMVSIRDCVPSGSCKFRERVQSGNCPDIPHSTGDQTLCMHSRILVFKQQEAFMQYNKKCFISSRTCFFCSELGTSELQHLRRFTKNKFVKEADK